MLQREHETGRRALHHALDALAQYLLPCFPRLLVNGLALQQGVTKTCGWTWQSETACRVLISWRNSNKLPSVHQQGVFLTHADVATGAEGAGRGAWPETLPTNELFLTDLCLYPLQPGEALLELECLFFGADHYARGGQSGLDEVAGLACP